MAAFYTFPLIVLAAFMISWGAEVAQFFMSQGLALAILAWLQTLPEFMVEATIAWNRDVHLMTANITGSLRLLVGVGWPLVYFTTAFSRRTKQARERFAPVFFHKHHSIEILGMLVPTLYFLVIFFKRSLTIADALLLIAIYVAYLLVLRKMPSEEMESAEDLPLVPRRIMRLKPGLRGAVIVSLFLGGGILLFVLAEPFLESMMGLSMVLGISSFTFVQWLAPFLTEFPEKLSAFKWAHTIKGAPMAVMNLISSVINQWTILAAMLPIVYSISLGHPATIPFDSHQRAEILLTIAQSVFAFLLVCRMRLSVTGASLIFFYWLVQFCLPGTRDIMAIVYAASILGILIQLAATRNLPMAFGDFARVYREHVRPKPAAEK